MSQKNVFVLLVVVSCLIAALSIYKVVEFASHRQSNNQIQKPADSKTRPSTSPVIQPSTAAPSASPSGGAMNINERTLSGTPVPTIITSEMKACTSSGGTWKVFTNLCADNCGTSATSMCGQALTDSCDCAAKCWDGTICK